MPWNFLDKVLCQDLLVLESPCDLTISVAKQGSQQFFLDAKIRVCCLLQISDYFENTRDNVSLLSKLFIEAMCFSKIGRNK